MVDVGGVPVVATGRDGDGHSSWGYMWVFALVIIFFALIFWGRNNEHKGHYGIDSIAPALAMGGVLNNKYNNNCCDCNYKWDEMKEFGEIKKEIMATSWAQQRENDKYFYEQQKTSLLGFAKVELEDCKNTSAIMSRIDVLERKMDNDKLRQLEIENSNFKQTIAIRGLGLVPSHPYTQMPYPYPIHGCESYC